ncbi:acyl-CoA ligase (AMP-forming), exosortase A system-associated [Novosphingobium sp.]|uniref:acyl-CoA ligase (AMP-forming), exosortase A system-associated n=1 Tax=Novosphingobium sp. TaxID=1874826 RepID=UPI003B51E417
MGAGDAPALQLGDRVMDYTGLNRRVGQLACWLAEQCGLRDRVASWLSKGEITCLLPLACARAGLIHVPVNPVLKRGQVAHILADSAAVLLITNLARAVTLEEDDLGACRLCDDVQTLAAVDACDPLPPSQAPVDDLVALLYTSGSTGRPKGVMISHANLWLGAHSVAYYTRLAPDDRVLAVLPLAFDYGQNQLLSAWVSGACVVPHDYLVPRDVLRAVERRAITTLAGVPPLWRQLAAFEWPAGLRRLTNSGGALDVALVRRLRALAPEADLYAMYGLTEAFRSTYLDPALIDAHPTAIGDAIPYAEILVVRDDGMPAGPGEAGELVHAGPLVAHGYWRDAARTAERFRAAPAWSQSGGTAVWSGDRVRRDAAGLLYFVGRRDAMIKTAGNRVSPQEVEDAALATGLVVDVVAFGLPDEALGQAIHCVASPTGEADSAALIAAMARDLPNFMVPRVVHWRDALPQNANGKVDRAALYRELSDLVDRQAS